MRVRRRLHSVSGKRRDILGPIHTDDIDNLFVNRLLSIGNIPPMTPDVEGLFGKMWKTLTDGEGPVCAQSGTRHSVLPKPVSLIVDVSETIKLRS